LFLRCLGTRAVGQVMGTEKQPRAKGPTLSGVKTWPKVQRMYASTVKDFFRFIRSWKIIAEFLCLAMVV
jgi:hypothetical protein